MRHVLFARPDQLDRHARHLLGDHRDLADIVGAAAPAEPAAEMHLVEVALLRSAGRTLPTPPQAPPRHSASGPTPRACRRVERGDVHRLHGGVVQVRIAVDRLVLARRAGDRRLGVAGLVADEGLFGVEALLEHCGDRGARDLGVRGLLVDDRQRVDRRLGVPERVGDDGDGAVADRHDLLHARHALDLRGVEALDLAAAHRRVLDGRDQHVRHLDVDAVGHLAGELVEGVEPLEPLPAIFQSLTSLSFTSFGGSSLAAASATLP